MLGRFFVIALVVAGIGVAACNTVEGAGKDVSSAGNAVANTAAEAK